MAVLLLNVVCFFVGVGLLYFGGDWLVDGSSVLARRFRIRPFVIGAVVIGFGTSAPEAFVSAVAQWKNSADLAFGNIVGSSIANIGLILGLAALIQPIAVERKLVRWEYPFLLAATAVLVGLSYRGPLLRSHAWIFFGLFALFLVWSLWQRAAIGQAGEAKDAQSAPFFLARIGMGFAGLLLGSELLVHSGMALARALGISELFLGTTLVAVSTSLPELAASCAAAVKKEPDLALGNVIGSNIFNQLFVTGLALAIRPIPIGPESRRVVLPALILMTLVLLPLFRSGRAVGRKAACLLLVSYGLFAAFLFAFRSTP